MNCQECQAALVNGVCPNAEAHQAVRFAEGLATAMTRAMEPVLAGVRETQTELLETVRALRPTPGGDAGSAGGDEDEQTRREREEGRDTVSATDAMSDVYDQLWNDPNRSADENFRNRRANLELAAMVMEGAGKIRANPIVIKPSEQFRNAWLHHVFTMPKRDANRYGSLIYVRENPDKPQLLRAMDTAESGNGADLVGAQYETELWAAARASDPLLALIRELPMRFPTDTIPVDGALPELRLLGESTTSGASAYTESDTPSSKATLTAKKLGINQLWSGEMSEDSIINYVEFLRMQLNRAAIHGLGSTLYNGCTTNAATGNINLDDADPADTKHYLAYNGIRHYWLVTATGQGKDMGGALDPKEIDRARGKLNGTTDDVDADFNNINWGANAQDLVLVCDFDTYMALQDLDEVRTIDKYGPNATVITGELGRVRGIRVVSPAYASKTEADGKASDTESNNTKGQITVFNPNGWIRGGLRGLSLYFDRVQRTDQFLFELYMRKAFTRFGGNVSAGIYDITV